MDISRLVMLCEQNELSFLNLLEWEEEFDDTVDGCRFSYERQRRKRKAPREWSIPRTGAFWEKIVPHATDEDFKQHFRLERSDLNQLIEYLGCMKKANTSFRKAIAVDKRIAIALYTLGTTAEYSAVAKLFGVSTPMVCKILNQFCKEVKRVLGPDFMPHEFLTQQATLQKCVQGFYDVHGIPQCIGAIGCCHMQLSVNTLLALVDYRGRFLYVEYKSPSNQPDAETYKGSTLLEMLDASPLIELNYKIMASIAVPLMLLGDSSYEMSPTLITPHPSNATPRQSVFNNALNEARHVVDRAFLELRARFGRLAKGLDTQGKPNDIIDCCCILHNFLSYKKSIICNSWVNNVPNDVSKPANFTHATKSDPEAEMIRQAISTKLKVRVSCAPE
ncbi:putative nuclease HARBI1 [Drosophila sulfurigaster albostrigata]|uniref:putative nuclease HARBI1 n=1 Tax=Drosophila sulfurigaster albostrigata TaxID=89887 RepID=UPI002D21A44A|nr:putative nuclease HARBI1 [Drosophila sulfurigaster albostrigata]